MYLTVQGLILQVSPSASEEQAQEKEPISLQGWNHWLLSHSSSCPATLDPGLMEGWAVWKGKLCRWSGEESAASVPPARQFPPQPSVQFCKSLVDFVSKCVWQNGETHKSALCLIFFFFL